MGKGPATFKQRDVAAAIKAAVKAGCEVRRIEIEKNGKIIVIVGGEPGGDRPEDRSGAWSDLEP